MAVTGILNGLRIVTSGGSWDVGVRNFRFYIVPYFRNRILRCYSTYHHILSDESFIIPPSVTVIARLATKVSDVKIKSNRQRSCLIIPHVINSKFSSDSLYEKFTDIISVFLSTVHTYTENKLTNFPFYDVKQKWYSVY